MQLDLRSVIHSPDATCPFHTQVDLSHWERYGERPISRPVVVDGVVTNHAGALTLEGTATSILTLTCDRCGKPFEREHTAELDSLLAVTLEDEENDDIILIENNQIDLDEVATTAFVLTMDTKNLCSDDCKGLCAKCGADLNLGSCQCRPEVDPRLAALAQLLDDMTE